MKLVKRIIAFLSCLTVITIPHNLNSTINNSVIPFFIHDNGHSGGMFAEFASVLGALKSYEQGFFTGIKVNFNQGVYLDPSIGSNWWEHYFEPIHIGHSSSLNQNCTVELCIHLANVGFSLGRLEAFNLIQTYIHIKPEINEEVEHFVTSQFDGHFMIGIHFRGTDKILEYPRTSYEEVYNHLQTIISSVPESQSKKLKVYVATDEQQFIDYLQDKIPHLLIYNEFTRSNDQITALHTGNHFSSNYQKGKEALIDCLLLSKCHLLLRPQGSCFSWASTLFNPQLESVIYQGQYLGKY